MSRSADVLIVGGGVAGAACATQLREDGGFVPKADTMIEAGDEVLLVLDPGLEDAIMEQFAPNGGRPD